MKILVVEDERKIAAFIAKGLKSEGFTVETASDGEEGLFMATEGGYDLIILDIKLPKMDGITVCRKLREAGNTQPIIMVTAMDSTEDKVKGLDAGADDYMTKPFSPRELVARVKAVLRRLREKAPEEILKSGTIELDVIKHELRLKGKPAEITAKEFELLQALMSSRGRVLTREVLLSKVWGYENSVNIETRTVDMHIGQLRKKLGKESAHIVTIKSIGYRFDGE